MPAKQYDTIRQTDTTAAGVMQRVMQWLPLFVFIIVISFLFFVVIPWVQVKRDDFVYGRPRTMHLTVDLNPTDDIYKPTHFIGMNLDRRVVVFAIPPEDAEKAQVLKGPYIPGRSADLIPVRLRMALVNDDPFPDLVIDVDGEEIIYVGENGKLRLINDQERSNYSRKLMEK